MLRSIELHILALLPAARGTQAAQGWGQNLQQGSILEQIRCIITVKFLVYEEFG